MTTLKEVRARFARDQGLPFAHTLSEHCILETLDEHAVKYRNRLFGPVTTIWGFLSHVLSEDHSCRDVVSRIIAHRSQSLLTQHRQLLLCPRPHSYGRAALLDQADGPAASGVPP